eukprot:GHVU01114105.1.p1 GENE.GHVU01114105.1~~GHVU01114105.1.p1  ORF type:complete len:133 (+),score=45.90 GHVU01114105.1:96-494(+)
MATLAQQLLLDLEEIDDDDDEEEQKQKDGKQVVLPQPLLVDEEEDAEIVDAVELYFRNKSESAVVVSGLSNQEEFSALLKRVRELLEANPTPAPGEREACLASEYDVIATCNSLVNKIDSEWVGVWVVRGEE